MTAEQMVRCRPPGAAARGAGARPHGARGDGRRRAWPPRSSAGTGRDRSAPVLVLARTGEQRGRRVRRRAAPGPSRAARHRRRSSPSRTARGRRTRPRTGTASRTRTGVTAHPLPRAARHRGARAGHRAGRRSSSMRSWGPGVAGRPARADPVGGDLCVARRARPASRSSRSTRPPRSTSRAATRPTRSSAPTATITFHRPKAGLLTRRGTALAGRVLVAPDRDPARGGPRMSGAGRGGCEPGLRGCSRSRAVVVPWSSRSGTVDGRRRPSTMLRALPLP